MDKKRHLTEKINRLLTMFPVVAIVGARQCGKSTLARQLRPDWRYYDLENPNDYQLISSDPTAFWSLHRDRVIIDEAQQYPELFRVLRGVIDERRTEKGRFLLTGSSSPAIVSGITDSLAGRIATVELWPFKQTEYTEKPLSGLYGLLADKATKAADFLQLAPETTPAQSMNIWFLGGFPEPLLAAAADPGFHAQWMEQYFMNYLGRDIRALFPRLNMHHFRRFLLLLAQFSGHQLNMSEMARALEVSVSTIREYLDIIHQTFLWRNMPAFTKNSLKKVQKANKGFFRDQGLLHGLLKISGPDALLLHPVAGFSFESFATEELIRGMQATMATGLEYSYYRTVDKSEVDLILEGNFGLIPIEVKMSSAVKRTDLRGLENFISDLNVDYGILINRGKRVERLTEKIVQVPVQYI